MNYVISKQFDENVTLKTSDEHFIVKEHLIHKEHLSSKVTKGLEKE